MDLSPHKLMAQNRTLEVFFTCYWIQLPLERHFALISGHECSGEKSPLFLTCCFCQISRVALLFAVLGTDGRLEGGTVILKPGLTNSIPSRLTHVFPEKCTYAHEGKVAYYSRSCRTPETARDRQIRHPALEAEEQPRLHGCFHGMQYIWYSPKSWRIQFLVLLI